ncbi:MAG: hypothetical protein IJX64_06055 [Clostridia bacterium]|nr:hypothetical protein [Clostridia bacterium]
MKKFSLLLGLLALLLCGCVVKPPAVTTDTQPTETTNIPETTAETDIPRYTVAMNRETLDKFLESIQKKALAGESYPQVYDIVAEEDSEIILRIHCIQSDGFADNVLTQVTYHDTTYAVKIAAFAGVSLDILYTPDLLIFGEHGGSGPGERFCLFYDGGMCGYDGKELLLDGVNDEVVKALRAPALDFTVKDGVLHYAKYYDHGVYQAIPLILEYADRPDALYSEEGILSFADGKLTMTVEKSTTMEEFFAERYYADYNVTNFADLMQALKDSLKPN